MRWQIGCGGLRQRVPGYANHANATLGDGSLNRESAHRGGLDCGVGRFAIIAAITEDSFGMRFLKVLRAKETGGHLTSDRKHGCRVAMRIVKPQDQMEVDGTARSGAGRDLPA